MKHLLQRHGPWIRWTSALLLVVGLCLLAHAFPLDLLMQRTRAWIGMWGFWSPLAFLGAYVVISLLLMPVWPFSLLAASLYGLWKGTLMLFVAGTSAAGTQFLISRYAAREATSRLLERYTVLGAVDEAISRGGWRIVALLRLSPLLPFGLQNYFYGLTAIRFWPYLIASALAMLPIEFLYVYAAYLGGSGLVALSAGDQQSHSWQFWVWQALGLGTTVAATGYVMYLARQAIERRIHDVRPEQEIPDDAVDEQQGWPLGTVGLVLLAASTIAVGIWAHL